MNILFIFSRHSGDPHDSTLTKDISDEFARQGANVYVMTMLEERYGQETSLSLENGYHVLRVKIGNYFNTKTKREKVLTILTLPSKFVAAAKKNLSNIKFDLILAHTPFVSSNKIITPLKKFFGCPAHLILWDIFPQNAWDIGIIRNRMIFSFFKRAEIKMLLAYDQIWCMSDGNVKYVREHYPELVTVKIERLYNSAKIIPLQKINRTQLRAKFGYTDSDVVAIFGGNMGVPQRLENIFALAKLAQDEHLLAKFLFVGSGTQTDVLRESVKQLNLKSIQFVEQLPRDEYQDIVLASDIALVSLDQRFTVPNFPSKTTDYCKSGLPILASLDDCSASDYGDFLVNIARCGRFAHAGDAQALFKEFLSLYQNSALRCKLGANGRKFYEKELDVNNVYHEIVASLVLNLDK